MLCSSRLLFPFYEDFTTENTKIIPITANIKLKLSTGRPVQKYIFIVLLGPGWLNELGGWIT